MAWWVDGRLIGECNAGKEAWELGLHRQQQVNERRLATCNRASNTKRIDIYDWSDGEDVGGRGKRGVWVGKQ